MRYAVLGTGDVGRTLATRLVADGHEVRMGARDASNERAVAWAVEAGERASTGTFADAAAFGERVVHATSGKHALDVIRAIGPDALADKVLVDVSNPLDFSNGFPPSLLVANTDSLAEQIQRAAPKARVVKALNTVANAVMVDPSRVPGEHDLLMCGDDDEAKAAVRAWLADELGWTSVIDLGPLERARATEAYLLLWTRLYGAFGHTDFNLRVVGANR